MPKKGFGAAAEEALKEGNILSLINVTLDDSVCCDSCNCPPMEARDAHISKT